MKLLFMAGNMNIQQHINKLFIIKLLAHRVLMAIWPL